MSRDTFDVTHVATSKHDNEVEWFGTKRETPGNGQLCDLSSLLWDASWMSQETLCMTRDTFDVTHVAAKR